ncbi:MAG: hypothetical protein AAF183_15655 [Pseudomonadota bacterium]
MKRTWAGEVRTIPLPPAHQAPERVRHVDGFLALVGLAPEASAVILVSSTWECCNNALGLNSVENS